MPITVFVIATRYQPRRYLTKYYGETEDIHGARFFTSFSEVSDTLMTLDEDAYTVIRVNVTFDETE